MGLRMPLLMSAFGQKRTLANPSTAGVRVREAFQLLLAPALDRPSLRRHRQIALDAHEILFCISFFAAVVRLRTEANAQLLDGCVSDDSGAGIAGWPH